MALSKNIQHKGFSLSNAYIKVLNVDVNKTACGCTVGYFASGSETEPLFTKAFNGNLDNPFTHDNDAGNALAQAYTYLKTLSEFSDEGDV